MGIQMNAQIVGGIPSTSVYPASQPYYGGNAYGGTPTTVISSQNYPSGANVVVGGSPAGGYLSSQPSVISGAPIRTGPQVVSSGYPAGGYYGEGQPRVISAAPQQVISAAPQQVYAGPAPTRYAGGAPTVYAGAPPMYSGPATRVISDFDSQPVRYIDDVRPVRYAEEPGRAIRFRDEPYYDYPDRPPIRQQGYNQRSLTPPPAPRAVSYTHLTLPTIYSV
eukprot:TRINITY_DN2235_c0_g1_i2.p1 TRINITY_DN2235_c0_g1~~TRINITY_DN2235_c0_g1_i2.p1  ORF type:complete len:252 (-),score=41.51 TRINITY_DN2235_c0_g1_i2:59-721(-)